MIGPDCERAGRQQMCCVIMMAGGSGVGVFVWPVGEVRREAGRGRGYPLRPGFLAKPGPFFYRLIRC